MEIQRDIILNSFLVESQEGFAQMEEAILELETRPEDGELIQNIFRVVHTAKGNASILELASLHSFAHAFENLLDELRNKNLAVTQEIINLMLAGLDILREMTAGAADGRDEIGAPAKKLLARISDCLASGPQSPSRKPVNDNEPAAAGTAKTAHASDALRTLRVEVSKLDRLLDLTGEIAVARGRIAQLLENPVQADVTAIREASRIADSLHTELQETVLRTRMVSVGPLFRQYSRTVRDLAKSHGKLARLQIEGEEVEVDTSVIEHLKDPVLHMIRNAIDHGIEPPAIRKRKGKSPSGTVLVRAAHQAASIVIEISDDGSGLSRERICDVARKRGLVAAPEKLADHDLFQLIFEAGFSTASTVSDLSGRGVGMDVVRRNVQALRGSVFITSKPGAGSTVHIRLPLTLAIIDGFGVGVGEDTYVIPLGQVLECVELPARERNSGYGSGVLELRGEPLPYVQLREHFKSSASRTARQNVVVVQHESHRAGLAVDRLYGATQTVIKPLPHVFRNIAGVSGSAILGNGRVALILDIPALLQGFVAEAASVT
ncbi:MAG: chemotaxis protein CheA [Candidatus Acidiferrum sp.]|jgi:two-component system chemotaxis sensor kinase CheA